MIQVLFLVQHLNEVIERSKEKSKELETMVTQMKQGYQKQMEQKEKELASSKQNVEKKVEVLQAEHLRVVHELYNAQQTNKRLSAKLEVSRKNSAKFTRDSNLFQEVQGKLQVVQLDLLETHQKLKQANEIIVLKDRSINELQDKLSASQVGPANNFFDYFSIITLFFCRKKFRVLKKSSKSLRWLSRKESRKFSC